MIMSLVNTAGTMADVVGVAVVGLLLEGDGGAEASVHHSDDDDDAAAAVGQEGLSAVFALSALVALVASGVYTLWGSVEEQFSRQDRAYRGGGGEGETPLVSVL
jgi:hypothetical protein